MHYDEKCLSVPNRIRRMTRSRSVTVEWRTPTGETQTRQFMGYDAVVVQHEMDHLDGKTLAG
jgi:peptide deformylase